MSLIEFEPRGESDSHTVSVGMNLSDRSEKDIFRLFVDGEDFGVFDWERVSEKSGAVDYIESETELRGRQLINLAELVIANCMHSIHPELKEISFPDEDLALAA